MFRSEIEEGHGNSRTVSSVTAAESKEMPEFATSIEDTANTDPNKHKFLTHGRDGERTKDVAKWREALPVTVGSLFLEQDQRVRAATFDMLVVAQGDLILMIPGSDQFERVLVSAAYTHS